MKNLVVAGCVLGLVFLGCTQEKSPPQEEQAKVEETENPEKEKPTKPAPGPGQKAILLNQITGLDGSLSVHAPLAFEREKDRTFAATEKQFEEIFDGETSIVFNPLSTGFSFEQEKKDIVKSIKGVKFAHEVQKPEAIYELIAQEPDGGFWVQVYRKDLKVSCYASTLDDLKTAKKVLEICKTLESTDR